MIPVTTPTILLLAAIAVLTILCLNGCDRRRAKDRQAADNIDNLFRAMRDTKEDLEQ